MASAGNYKRSICKRMAVLMSRLSKCQLWAWLWPASVAERVGFAFTVSAILISIFGLALLGTGLGVVFMEVLPFIGLFAGMLGTFYPVIHCFLFDTESRSATTGSAILNRTCRLLGYLMTPKHREQVYEPACEELVEDYIIARRQHTSKWSRRWLGLCYTIHAGTIFVQSLWSGLNDKVRRVIFWGGTTLFGIEAAKRLRWFLSELFRLP
jgi:hypothetical protein